MIANICSYIYLPTHQEYGYLCKQKNLKKFVCIFLHQLVNTCDLHLVLYIAISSGFKQEISLVEDLDSTTTTSKHQRFTLNIQF